MLTFRCRQVTLLFESSLQFVHLTTGHNEPEEGHECHSHLSLGEEDAAFPALLVDWCEVGSCQGLVATAGQESGGRGSRRWSRISGPGRVAGVVVEGVVVRAVRGSG